MTQGNKPGMALRQVPNPRKKDSLWLIQALTAMLSGTVMSLMLTGITGNGWLVMTAAALCLSLAYGILLKTGHENWFYMGLLGISLALTLLCRRQILEGFRIFWNSASDAMVLGTGWVLPEWQLQLGSTQQDLCAALFAGLCACLICLVCCGLTSAAPALLALLLPAVLVLAMTVLGGDAGALWLLPVLALSVLILIYSDWRKKGASAPVVMSWAICALAACLLMAGSFLPGIQNRTAQLREDVHHAIHERKYETKYTTLPEGDFTRYQKADRKAEPALAVTMDQPQQLYLRGFTGAVFADDAWEPLDTQALAKNKDLLYWLNLNVFDQNAQFDAASVYAGMAKNTVTVQNIGACSYYRYVPFSISKGAWAQAENLNTDGVYAEGARSYVYSVTGGSTDEILQVLTQLQTSDDPAVLQYRKAESGYRQFVSHYYLQVPEDVKALLQEQWDGIAGTYGSSRNLTLQQAQECTLIFLSRCFPEEGTPEDITLPLEMAAGTSYQYATVAAMTLRYFGIPARYAEGYVITPEMAGQSAGGQTITVDSSCARAWVEVYQDGIGWIPMDLTPGIGEILENPESSKHNEQESSKKDPKEKQEEEEPEEEEQQQPDPIGGSVVMVLLKTMLTGFLTLALVLSFLFLILWIRRWVLRRRKEQKFRSPEVRDGIGWIYEDTARILEKLGFDRGNGSMRQLTEPLEAQYGADFAAQFEAVTDLNDRALFSAHPLDEEHRETVLRFRSQVLANLRTDVKWYRRMWLKWVRCLY